MWLKVRSLYCTTNSPIVKWGPVKCNSPIICDNQHGFRQRRSCETQLNGTINEICPEVTLLLIYLSMLFLLARLLEAVTWYDQGQLSRRLLDPMTLSVLKLKALLEQRGVSFDNVVEKSELTQLVEATGPVSQEETSELVTGVPVEDSTVTNYTCGLDFYEQVEDNKDSMWLVEVIVDSGRPTLLAEASWKSIRKKVGKFGVRFGRFDCQLDNRACLKKGWLTSRIVLALPETYRSKSNVALHSYPAATVRVTSLFDWMKTKIDTQIETIDDHTTFASKWLNYDSFLNPEVRVLFTSTLSTMPLFLSALSVRFPGRVKIGSINTKTAEGKLVSRQGQIHHIPSYLIITPERRYVYGQRPGEKFTFQSMELFLKSLHPNLNDFFIVSMVFTNILSFFEVSLCSGTIMRRLLKLLWCIFKFNMVLMLLWIALLAVLQLPLMEVVGLWALKFLRYFTGSSFFSLIRKDIQLYTSHFSLPFIALGALLTIVRFLNYYYGNGNEEEEGDSDWWNFSNIRTLQTGNWLDLSFSPFDQIFNPRANRFTAVNQSDQEQHFVSKDYIPQLAAWRFQARAIHVFPRTGNSVQKHQMKESHGTENITESHCLTRPRIDNENVMDSNYTCECNMVCSCPESGRHGNAPEAPHGPGPDQGIDRSDTSGALTGDATLVAAGADETDPTSTNCAGLEARSPLPSFPPGYIEGTQCVICLESYLPLVLLRGLPCGHVFHDCCLLEWLNRDNHFCPVCRWPSYKSKPQPASHLHIE